MRNVRRFEVNAPGLDFGAASKRRETGGHEAARPSRRQIIVLPLQMLTPEIEKLDQATIERAISVTSGKQRRRTKNYSRTADTVSISRGGEALTFTSGLFRNPGGAWDMPALE